MIEETSVTITCWYVYSGLFFLWLVLRWPLLTVRNCFVLFFFASVGRVEFNP